MIERGEKLEEYREIKPFWRNRLAKFNSDLFENDLFVKFYYGYTSKTMLFKLKSIKIGQGNPLWGAPDYNVFVLSLGERVQ